MSMTRARDFLILAFPAKKGACEGGQLSIYADALARATGRPVAEAWIVLPVAAGVIQLSADR